jgi:CxxC motif-containing protein (DUF1111 family)
VKKPRNRFEKSIVCFVAVGFALIIVIAALNVTNAATNDPKLRASWMSHPVSADLGGGTTVDKTGERAFKFIAANAEGMSMARFTFGKQLFETVWEPAPGSQPTTDGLGPVFNRSACAHCHIGNGRGRPPAATDGTMDSILVRLSIEGTGMHGGPKPVPGYGDQLQDRSIDGVPAEGRAVMVYNEVNGKYADGTEYSLRRPTVSFVDMAFGELPAAVMTSPRVASPLIGLGLLEAVPDTSLRALADPDDQDDDGISGRVNIVWDAVNNMQAIGRFGWKANAPSLRHQNAAAAIGDMGITTPVFGVDLCEPIQETCSAVASEVADSPELLSSFFDPLVRYTQLVAVPRQRGAENPEVQRGAATFRGLGCASCHMPTLKTGRSELGELADQVIHPFSDLLLHDMGEGLADNRPDFEASGREWRTPPLWGIGLTDAVGGFQLYLHDGRARGLEEAILWHGGEAVSAQQAFRNLPAVERTDLLAFLGSL